MDAVSGSRRQTCVRVTVRDGKARVRAGLVRVRGMKLPCYAQHLLTREGCVKLRERAVLQVLLEFVRVDVVLVAPPAPEKQNGRAN